MNLSRRDLLGASALLLAGPGAVLRAAAREGTAAGPLVLCWNENPYGPSPAARAAVSRSVADACRYPDDEVGALTAALAAREGVSADHIVTGTGSGELLRALGLIYGRDGGEIIAAQPTYDELAHYAQVWNAAIRHVPLDAQLRHDLPAMHAAVSARTRAVYLCNPNNPTGTAVAAAQIREFVRSLPPTVTTIVDEAYMDFAAAGATGSVVDLVSGAQPVIVLRTFSKIHGMAGMRCGYAIAPADIAATLASARMSTANIFAVRAALASLGDAQFLADCRQRILASRTRITGLMRERNILVGRLFPPFDTWCRITIGTEPEVASFLKALREIVASA